MSIGDFFLTLDNKGKMSKGDFHAKAGEAGQPDIIGQERKGKDTNEVETIKFLENAEMKMLDEGAKKASGETDMGLKMRR